MYGERDHNSVMIIVRQSVLCYIFFYIVTNYFILLFKIALF